MDSLTAGSLSLEQIERALDPFGVSLQPSQLTKIQGYVSLLCKWNQSLSLTAVEDPIEIVARHFGESIFAGRIQEFRHGRLADVGTGAGFPGLALKIAYPHLDVVLLEPNLKKCAFLKEVKDALDLHDVEIVRSRYEDYEPESPFDFICSRALGDHKRFIRWCRKILDPQGRILLWLGLDDSILVCRSREFIWDPPLKIPESRRRFILSGRPSRA